MGRRIERLLLSMVRLVLPRGGREWMMGDIQEEHAHRAAARGRWPAARWLAAETVRNTIDRLRIGGPPHSSLLPRLGGDIGYAVRLLRRSPVFTMTTVATLALGIGANTAIFSVVDALLFKPLPYPHADRLFAITLANDTPDGMQFWPVPKYRALARDAGPFELTAAYARNALTIDTGGEPQRVEAEVVSSSYFSLFGARPALGRTFTADEDAVPARDAVIVLGDGIWRDMFGADPHIVGRTLRIKGRAYSIIGVMPRGFRGQTGMTQVWLPVMMADHFAYEGASTGGFAWWMRVAGRLKPGLTAEMATAEMPAVTARVGAIDQSRIVNATRGGHELFQLVPFRDIKVDPDVRRSFVVLLAAVGFVLLIACANTANLLLGRGVTRQPEFALRRALGASSRDVVRQVLVEGLVLTTVAGAAALAVAWGTLQWLTTVKPMNATGFWSQYARTFDYFAVALEPRVLAFNFGVALAVGVLFAGLPARQAARSQLHDSLKQRSAGSIGFGRPAVRSGLVAAEMAISLVLLASAGLLIKSFANAARADLGFDPANVVTMTASSHERKPATFYRDLLARVARAPGVEMASLVLAPPITGTSWRGPVRIDGRGESAPSIQASSNVVTPSFFATFRLRLLEGRLFTDDDREVTSRVAIVNRTFAQSAWPGQSAVGRHVRTGFRVAYGDQNAWITVVGVVDDVVYGTLEEPRTAMIYTSAWQPYGTPAAMSLAPTTIAVRTANAAAAVAAIRAEVRAIDPAMPLYEIATMDERADRITARYRYSGAMMSALAGLALLLAAIGTYGVVAFAVATRTREIGVRVALGARPADVLRLVLGGGLKLAAAGVMLGLGAALASARVLATMLYGVTPHDPVTFAAIGAIVAAVAAAATYVPARRAMRVDPVVALRGE
jgi:putative ABC transport system permease protein